MLGCIKLTIKKVQWLFNVVSLPGRTAAFHNCQRGKSRNRAITVFLGHFMGCEVKKKEVEQNLAGQMRSSSWLCFLDPPFIIASDLWAHSSGISLESWSGNIISPFRTVSGLAQTSAKSLIIIKWSKKKYKLMLRRITTRLAENRATVKTACLGHWIMRSEEKDGTKLLSS